MTKCDCRPCAVCNGVRVICNKCNMCTRCHEHAPGCPGCVGKLTPKQAERAEAKARLLEWLKPGDTVYTIVRHVSRSGMQRELGVVLLKVDEKATDPKFKIIDLHVNVPVARVLGWRVSKDRDAVIVGGTGMDMGFHLVYELSHALFGDGYALTHKWL